MIERDRNGTFTRAELIAIGWVLVVAALSRMYGWDIAILTGGGILLLLGAGWYIVDHREVEEDDDGPWSR